MKKTSTSLLEVAQRLSHERQRLLVLGKTEAAAPAREDSARERSLEQAQGPGSRDDG
jgi:hypothetical protein